MSAASERKKLSAIAHEHSYEAGFNGRLGRYRMRLLAEHSRPVKSSSRVLEIGAGEGPITSYLAERFAHVDAIEPADDFFARLEQRFARADNVRLHHSLFEETEVSGTYPLIVASGVLEHVRAPQEFLAKVRALLTEQGLFIATVPNATSLHRRLGVAMGLLSEVHELSALDHKVGHHRYYDFESLRGEVQMAGFTVTGLEGLVLKPFPNSKMDELADDFCDALFSVGRTLPEWCAEIFVCAKKES